MGTRTGGGSSVNPWYSWSSWANLACQNASSVRSALITTATPSRWPSASRDLSLTRSTSPRTAPPRSTVARSCDVLAIGVLSLHGLGQPVDQTGLGLGLTPGDQDIAIDTLSGVLAQPKTSAWSGVTVDSTEPFDGVWLRMTGTEPSTCRIAADPAAIESGLATPAIPSRSPALVERDSLAYFTFRRLEDRGERRSELGAIGHGPAGAELAERFSWEIASLCLRGKGDGPVGYFPQKRR
jgi:hypothetical protein